VNLNLDFISEKFGDGKVAELNLSPKMGTMVKNIQKPLAFIQKVYMAKEALHRLYRCRGYKKARRSLIKILDWLAHSKLKELQRLRKTLMNWKNEILNFFKTRITNAKTEGFNNVAKSIIKRAYGFRNFNNYRLRVLNA